MDEHQDLLRQLRSLGTQSIDPARQSADLSAMTMARPAPRIARKLRIAGALVAGVLLGGTGLAAAEVLPDPAQHVAHTVLNKVGVDVPDPDRYHGAECGEAIKKNHGAYVRDDHTLAKSDCGKKLHTQGAGDGQDADEGGEKADKADKGACRGKPSWAGDTSLTAEDRAVAEAARAAECGTDADDADKPASIESDDPAVETEQPDTPDPTSTTLESSTTSEASTTTTTG